MMRLDQQLSSWCNVPAIMVRDMTTVQPHPDVVPAAALGTAYIRPPPAARHSNYVLELTIVFAAYFVAERAVLALPFTIATVSPVWLPSAIALAALLLVGYRVWPAIAAAAFLVNALTPTSPYAALALAVVSTTGPLVVAWLVRRIPGFRSSVGRLDDVLGPMRSRSLPELAALLSTAVITCMVILDNRAGLGTPLRVSLAMITVSGLMLAAVIGERARSVSEPAERGARERHEQRARDIMDTATDGVWMLDAQLVTMFVNARMADMLGYTVEGMSGRPLSDFIPSATWDETQVGLRRPGPAVREHVRIHYRRKDGSEFHASVSRTRAFGEGDTFAGVLKIVSVSDPKRAEGEWQQARGSVVLLSKAVEQTADSVLISDSAGCIEYVNPAFEATTGYTQAEVLGKTPRFLKSGQHGEPFYQQMWASLIAGEPYRATLVNRKKTGELYWANQTITPIKDSQGTITHFVAVLKDVTEARKYHEQEVRLRLARGVQQRFSPPPPRLPDFDIAAASYPADETGGDYFDFIEGPNGTLYVAVGDVSGHGFDAALIMALTRAYMRTFATLGMEVGEVLSHANRAILGDLEENRYVTMLLVRLDPQAGSMTYANAGHIAGVLLNAAGDIDGVLDSTGVPLGLFAHATFATRHVRFSSQHILVLGTDGATETLDAGGMEFGGHGVIEYVRTHANDSADEIATGVFRAARSFAGAEQRDDITSVIVKVTKTPVGVEQAVLCDRQHCLPSPPASPLAPDRGTGVHPGDAARIDYVRTGARIVRLQSRLRLATTSKWRLESLFGWWPRSCSLIRRQSTASSTPGSP